MSQCPRSTGSLSCWGFRWECQHIPLIVHFATNCTYSLLLNSFTPCMIWVWLGVIPVPCFDLSRVSLSSAVMLLKQPVLAILWAAVCVGTLLSQPVWHWEFALGFTVVASFCQHSACGTFLIQPLSLLSEGLLGMEKIPFLFYVLQCAHLTSEHCISWVLWLPAVSLGSCLQWRYLQPGWKRMHLRQLMRCCWHRLLSCPSQPRLTQR